MCRGLFPHCCVLWGENKTVRDMGPKTDDIYTVRAGSLQGVLVASLQLNSAIILTSRSCYLIFQYSLYLAQWPFIFQKINAINAQYEGQLAALRARHANRRDEFLRRESQGRQHQYQQAMMDQYPNSGMGSADPHGYSGVATSAAAGEAHRGYNSDNFDSNRERARFLGGARDHGFEPRGSYPGGRVYDTGSRYY